MPSTNEMLALADWRRRIAELYAEVRRLSATDPAAAHATWRAERESLYRCHPASPVPAARARRCSERSTGRTRMRWRRTAPLVADDAPARSPPIPDHAPDDHCAPAISFIPASTGAPPPLELAGHVALAIPGGQDRLPVLRLLEYSGGIFLPFGDATNGDRHLRGRAVPARHGEGRGPRRDPRRRADPGLQLRVPAVVRLRPAVGVPARAAGGARLAIAIEAGERLR